MVKGKLVKRSWADLPHEVIRLVAEDVISAEAPWVPTIWTSNTRHPGHARVWAVLMKTQMLSNLQHVCRRWETALNTAPYWSHAINALDPMREHAVFNRKSDLTPSDMFRHITNTTCIPCRINNFHTSAGIGTSARQQETTFASVIGCCAAHQPNAFCSVCLSDGLQHHPSQFIPPMALDRFGRWQNIRLHPNYDTEAFGPHAKFLCLSCRTEELRSSIFRELGPQAWDHAFRRVVARQALSEFFMGGIGDIENIVANVSEQAWLSAHCPAYEQAINQQFHIERKRRAHRDVITPEDDVEAIRAVTHPKYIQKMRGIALSSWAQDRISEGVWVSPFDTLSNHFAALEKRIERAHQNGAFAEHPFAQLIPEYGSDFTGSGSVEIGDHHSEQLSVDLAAAFDIQFKRIVAPALRNCLRRLMAAADARGFDICRWVWSIKPEDLLGPEFLRAPQIWCPKYDWVHHYSPISRPTTSISSEEGSPKAHTLSDATSSGDERPSPATTMRTTPSPSPNLKAKALSIDTSYSAKTASQIIAELAVSEPPSPTDEEMMPLERVPHIPCSPDLVGKNVHNLLRDTWREITASVFDCPCSICTRGAEAAKEASKAAGIDLLQRLDPQDWQRERQTRSPIGYESEEDDYRYSDNEYFDDDDEEDDLDDELEEIPPNKGAMNFQHYNVVGSNFPPEPPSHPTVTPPTIVDPRLAMIASLPVAEQITVLSRSVMAPPVGAPIAAHIPPPPPLTNNATRAHAHSRARTPGPPSLAINGSRRRSRSDSESDYDDDGSGSGRDENESRRKRQRSSSLERVAGERRFRDDADVGGPDGEIVDGEHEHGHGRKRVRSFDGDNTGGVGPDDMVDPDPLVVPNAESESDDDDDDAASEDSSAAFELRPVHN